MDIIAIFVVLTALLAYVNQRFLGLPTGIGVMAIALVLCIVSIALDHLGVSSFRTHAETLLSSVDFSRVLLQGMLSALLFAGALHVDLSELRKHRWEVGLLAFAGTVASTVAIGVAIWFVLPWIGLEIPIGFALAFGALISPTDPIAVIGILKSAKTPRSVEVVLAGESLFNDGVGVVLFLVVVELLTGSHTPSVGSVSTLLLQEAGGGILFGVVLGYVTFHLLKSIDSYQEEVLITLAAVLGGYALADRLQISGPLAMVVAGLIVGNHGRELAMSDTTRLHVDLFWELIDTILNAVLFVLIAIELLRVNISVTLLGGAAIATVISICVRALTVAAPLAFLRGKIGLPRGSWKVLTWGGLRGGIAIALALSLPPSPNRDLVLSLTYGVVIFSILVQGLTVGRLARHTFYRLE